MATRTRASRVTAATVPAVKPDPHATAESSSKLVNSSIKAALDAHGKATTLIHVACMAILRHSAQYNDCTGAARLVDGMGKHSRRSLVGEWFAKYSPIVVTMKADKAKAHYGRDKDGNRKPFDIDAAEANPWHKLAKSDEKGAFNYTNSAFIDELYKSASSWEKRIKDGKVGDDEVPAIRDSIAKTKALASALRLTMTQAPANNNPASQPERQRPPLTGTDG